jgi:uncharacterized protein
MWYAILSEDVDDSLPLRETARTAHLERVQQLVAAGRVLAGGPHPAIDAVEPGEAGFTGSLLIVEFPSLQEAEEWAAADPYVEAGVYRRFTVKPFVRVVP